MLWKINTIYIKQSIFNLFQIILAFAAIGYAAPAADPQLLQSGLPAGPLTPAWGDGVLTPRGVRPLHLEGFSEDVNQDRFADPIGQAAVAVAAPAVYHHAPAVYHPAPAHVFGAGAPILGGLPVVAAAKPAEEAVVAEE